MLCCYIAGSLAHCTLAYWHIGTLLHCHIILILGSLPVAAQILQPMPIVEEKVEYDALTNRYLIRTIIGGQEMDVPIIMTPAEYLDWSMKRSMQNYYRRVMTPYFLREKRSLTLRI